jgi:phage-related protein
MMRKKFITKFIFHFLCLFEEKFYATIKNMSWKVKFFQSARGDYPVIEFIGQQEIITQAKITHLIELLENYGPYLKPPYIKKIQKKLFELRISGKNAIRIFYTILNQEYYLLHAFKKKSNKTPVKEIKTALDRINELI